MTANVKLSGSGNDETTNDDAEIDEARESQIQDLYNTFQVFTDVSYKLAQHDSTSDENAEALRDYAEYLQDVTQGPGDSFNGLGSMPTGNNKQYRRDHGQSVPSDIETVEEGHKVVNTFYDGDIDDQFSESVPSQDHIKCPVQDGEKVPYGASAETLEDSKQLVYDLVADTIPSVSWLPEPGEDTESVDTTTETETPTETEASTAEPQPTETTNDSETDIEPEIQRLVENVKGFGEATAEHLQRYIVETDEGIHIDPSDIDLELTPVDMYDSLDEVPPETVKELSTEQITAIQS